MTEAPKVAPSETKEPVTLPEADKAASIGPAPAESPAAEPAVSKP